MVGLAIREAPRSCPRCTGPMFEVVSIQPALFRDCGYGAAEKQTTLICRDCGRAQPVVTESLR